MCASAGNLVKPLIFPHLVITINLNLLIQLMTANDKNIMWLLSAFDYPRTAFFHYYYHGDLQSWRPSSREEQEAFHQLTAAGNRAALKAWYHKQPSIHPVADAFRRILEKAINEELPIRQAPTLCPANN